MATTRIMARVVRMYTPLTKAPVDKMATQRIKVLADLIAPLQIKALAVTQTTDCPVEKIVSHLI